MEKPFNPDEHPWYICINTWMLHNYVLDVEKTLCFMDKKEQNLIWAVWRYSSMMK